MLIDYNDKNIIFAINGDENKTSYSASYELEKIVNILELNQKKYDNFEKIYEFISKLIKKKRIELKFENGKYNIIIEHYLDDELIKSKITLSKTIINDKEIIGLLNDKLKNEEKIKILENVVQKQDEKIKKLEENNAKYIQKLNNLENEIKIMIGKQNENINNLEENRKIHTKKFTDLENEIKILNNKVKINEEKINQNQEEFNNLGEQIRELKGQRFLEQGEKNEKIKAEEKKKKKMMIMI